MIVDLPILKSFLVWFSKVFCALLHSDADSTQTQSSIWRYFLLLKYLQSITPPKRRFFGGADQSLEALTPSTTTAFQSGKHDDQF
ncbi:hypothetical protein SAMN05444000_1326 [Shimia gijangensis]|uniref:Uncharacterized protein n=1 Tax=Shimia gijangensis TaxID=1470563 RepID=A0A1M6STD4_9RHOB|nr:hypothetical protein SAMN05444000_1326 [Shimia gijangensis]